MGICPAHIASESYNNKNTGSGFQFIFAAHTSEKVLSILPSHFTKIISTLSVQR